MGLHGFCSTNIYKPHKFNYQSSKLLISILNKKEVWAQMLLVKETFQKVLFLGIYFLVNNSCVRGLPVPPPSHNDLFSSPSIHDESPLFHFSRHQFKMTCLRFQFCYIKLYFLYMLCSVICGKEGCLCGSNNVLLYLQQKHGSHRSVSFKNHMNLNWCKNSSLRLIIYLF